MLEQRQRRNAADGKLCGELLCVFGIRLTAKQTGQTTWVAVVVMGFYGLQAVFENMQPGTQVFKFIEQLQGERYAGKIDAEVGL